MGKNQLDSGMLVSCSENEQTTTYESRKPKLSTRIKLRSIGNNLRDNTQRRKSCPRSLSPISNSTTSFFSRSPSHQFSDSEFSDFSDNVRPPPILSQEKLEPMLPQEKLEFLAQSSFLQGNGLQECFGYGPPVEGAFFDIDSAVDSRSTTTNSLLSPGGTTTDKKVIPILDLLKVVVDVEADMNLREEECFRYQYHSCLFFFVCVCLFMPWEEGK